MKLFAILSPTWFVAFLLKSKFNRTKVIKNLNTLYLSISVVSIVALFVYQQFIGDSKIELNATLSFPILFLWVYFLISRVNEIFFSFLNDALDKLSYINKSELLPKDRIVLALKSYLELIINFATIYLLLPTNANWWTNGNNPQSIFDSLYFSGATITTLGYGDISPIHWSLRLLTIYEVFCGFILLIVCFTIYNNKYYHYEDNKQVKNKAT